MLTFITIVHGVSLNKKPTNWWGQAHTSFDVLIAVDIPHFNGDLASNPGLIRPIRLCAA